MSVHFVHYVHSVHSVHSVYHVHSVYTFYSVHTYIVFTAFHTATSVRLVYLDSFKDLRLETARPVVVMGFVAVIAT